jgi:VWFA-related protein
MLLRPVLLPLFIAALVLIPASSLRAQQPQSAPAPQKPDEQDQVRVFTEEVRISVAAFNEYGYFDPTLEMDDLTVLEDGVPQQIKSLRRIPASVLIALDTGGDMNPAKSVNNARQVALNLVSRLNAGDQIAVLQFNDRVEMVQEWTTDQQQVKHTLETKLLSGKRSCLSDALLEAAREIGTRPAGNRHLVLITDGAETRSGKAGREQAIKRLIAANVTVHVINSTALGQLEIKRKQQTVRPRDRSRIPDVAIDSLPPSLGNVIRTPGGITIDLDRELRRRRQEYEDAMHQSEPQLARLAEETGGEMWTPASVSEMVAKGSEAARNIGAQYVITYRPKRPLTAAARGEYRRIEVVPRRLGLQLRARRGYIARTEG